MLSVGNLPRLVRSVSRSSTFQTIHYRSYMTASLEFSESEVLLATSKSDHLRCDLVPLHKMFLIYIFFCAPPKYTAFPSRDTWAEHLRAAGLRLQVHPDQISDLSRVEFAICWQPEPGLLRRCPNLKAVQAMGAGVDSLLIDPTLPSHVPILRVRLGPLLCRSACLRMSP